MEDELTFEEPAIETGQRMQTNQAAPATACETCVGDQFVVVSLRKPQQTIWMKEHGITPNETEMIEEMAPCPDCNSGVNTSFRRHDDSRALPLDPARVQEMMRG